MAKCMGITNWMQHEDGKQQEEEEEEEEEEALPNLGPLLPHVFGASNRLPASILSKKRRYCSISGPYFER
jgi:hypothetical protein